MSGKCKQTLAQHKQTPNPTVKRALQKTSKTHTRACFPGLPLFFLPLISVSSISLMFILKPTASVAPDSLDESLRETGEHVHNCVQKRLNIFVEHSQDHCFMETQIITRHELRRFKSHSANGTCHLLQDRKLRGDHPGYVGCVEACDPVLFMSSGLECDSGPKMEVQTGPGGKVKERGGEEGDRIQDGQLRTLRHLTLFSSWETGTQRQWVKKEGHFTKT